jgi:hypothetical protein
MVAATDIETLNRVAGGTYLDLTVPTDNRPFFFNQLRFSRIPETRRGTLRPRRTKDGQSLDLAFEKCS